MGDWSFFGRVMVYIGFGLALLGLIIWGMSRILPIGRLPGDIFFQREGFSIYFPIATCLLLSLLLTILLNLFRR